MMKPAAAKFPLKSPKGGFSKLTRIKSVPIIEEIEIDEQVFSVEEDEYENETESMVSTTESTTEYNLCKPGFPFYEITKYEKRPRYMFMENFKLTDYTTELNRTNLTNRILKKLPMSDEIIHQLCYSLVEDARQYAHKVNFSNGQGWALMDMFYHIFMILCLNFTQSRDDFYELFRETLILYTYDQPPYALKTFSVLECFGIAKLFEELFEQNYDVLRTVFFMPFADIKIELK